MLVTRAKIIPLRFNRRSAEEPWQPARSRVATVCAYDLASCTALLSAPTPIEVKAHNTCAKLDRQLLATCEAAETLDWLRLNIQNGTYGVDPGELAELIFDAVFDAADRLL